LAKDYWSLGFLSFNGNEPQWVKQLIIFSAMPDQQISTGSEKVSSTFEPVVFDSLVKHFPFFVRECNISN
jgi:hypothetical protein